MENMPSNDVTLPPPPPPRSSRKALWIGLIIGAAILFLCLLAAIVGIYFFRLDIPILSDLLPTPKPPDLVYNNPATGIKLNYPAAWKYSETGDAANGYAIIFASSEEILNNSSNAPQTGAALAILTNFVTTGDLSFQVTADTMGGVVDFIATQFFSNFDAGQNLRTYSLDGLPAASRLYTMTNDTGGPSAVDVTAVLRNDVILLIFSICPQREWSLYQGSFSSILDSLRLVTP
jgi:hypothetical protein